MKSPLEIENVIKDYGSLRAVSDISFKMEPGEIFGLLGPNGSGKTTLISIISTLIEASAGGVKIFGQEVGMHNQEPKRLLGVVPQEIVSHGFFTVEEILVFLSGYYEIRNNLEHIHYTLERLGLFEHRHKRVTQLSGGMKRRLLIAKALVHKPKLLLLDEPTAGVDIELRNALWEFVRELHKEGTSILLTTHYLEEAEELCNRIGIINLGSLIKIDKTQNIIAEFTQTKVELICEGELNIEDNEYFIQREQAKYIFQIPATMTVGELLKKCSIDLSCLKDLKVKEGDLEEAFVRVLGEHRNTMGEKNV